MQRDHVAYLDGWRGLAILFVLLGHFAQLKGVNFGPFGVELFFVLSGRLMAELLIVRKTPLKIFFWRRFSRIYPGLLAFCLPMLIISVVGSLLHINIPKSAGFPEFFAAIFFVMNYTTSMFGMSTVLEHIWSLSVEEHSYLILALIGLFVAQRNSAACFIATAMGLLMMASGVLQYMLSKQSEHQLYWRTDVRAASVFVSFALYLFIDPMRRKVIAPGWLAIACVFIAGVLNFDVFPIWIKYSAGSFLLALAVNTIDHAYPIIKTELSRRWLTFAGTLSYSAYLWQQPFFLASYEKHSILVSIAALVGVGVAALCSFYLVERPAREYLNGLLSRRDVRGVTRPTPAP